MRSTWAQAVASSVARSLAMRVSKAARMSVLVEAAHGDDEREAELGRVGVVQLGEAGALGVGQRVEAGAGLLGGRTRRSGASAAASLPARSGWAVSTPSRSSSEAERKARASALCEARRRCRGRGRARARGRARRSRASARRRRRSGRRSPRGPSRSGAGAGRAPGGGRAQWRAMSIAARDPDPVVGEDVVDEAGEGGGAAGAADQAAVQADRHHLRAAGLALGVEGVEGCPCR